MSMSGYRELHTCYLCDTCGRTNMRFGAFYVEEWAAESFIGVCGIALFVRFLGVAVAEEAADVDLVKG